MRTLSDDYCPICREQAVLAIYGSLPSLLSGSEPQEDEVLLPASFSVDTLGPDEGVLEVTWSIDGVEVAQGHQAELPCLPGKELTVTVRDPTPWVRYDPDGLLRDERTWRLIRCTSDSADTGDPDRPRPPCGACSPVAASPWMGLVTALVIAAARFRV